MLVGKNPQKGLKNVTISLLGTSEWRGRSTYLLQRINEIIRKSFYGTLYTIELEK